MRIYRGASDDSEPETEPTTLGGKVRRRRCSLGLTQAHAAERLGTTESTVNNWERGRTEPAARFLPAITTFLAVATPT